MKPLPKSLSVCGILNIVFGALGVLTVLSNVLMQASGAFKSNPAYQVMEKFPEVQLYTKVMLVPTLLFGILAIVAGIHLMKAREWARKASIAYALWSLLGIAGGIWMNHKIVPAMMEAMSKSPGLNENAAMIAKSAVGVGVYAGMIMGSIYPIALLILMTRPRVRAACSSVGESPAIPPPLR